MKKKFIYKIVIDMIMTVLLLFLMARQLTGDSTHEWLGAGMLILWIAHHILNRSWYSHLFKGRYTPMRILQTVTDFAVLLSMLGLMMSGIILSREVFAFLPVSGGIALSRPLHVLSLNVLTCFFYGIYCYHGPVCFSGTLYFQGDSKAGRKEEKTCGEKEINI